mgnify:CR=1 FL=1
MAKILIKNGQIITPAETLDADLLIENGKISQVGKGLEAAGAEEIDARGKFILPGGIDPKESVGFGNRLKRIDCNL